MTLSQCIYSALIGFILFAANTAMAASPLAVDFHSAYSDTPAVQQARAAGKLNNEIASFLVAPNAIGEKAAVINVLNNKSKQQNAKTFRDFLAKNTGGTFNADSLGGDEQFALGYLTALDDPAQSQKSIPMLEKAKALKPDSFTVAMILNLVKAQQQIGKTPCRAWLLTEEVLNDNSLTMDMREDAVESIEESMDAYKKEPCK